jgi:hypothetical protein
MIQNFPRQLRRAHIQNWCMRLGMLICGCLLGSMVRGQGLTLATMEAYPSYGTVVTVVLDSVGGALPDPSVAISSLVKDPEGWKLRIARANGATDLVMIWSAAELNYAISPERARGRAIGSARDVLENVFDQQRMGYDEHVYYGYPTWCDDVIERLRDKPKLSDYLLNALARAYARAAAGKINTRWTSDSIHPYDRDWDIGVFSEFDFAEYGGLKEKAIATFQKLAAQNPYMPLVVGTPDIKLANEYMDAWLEMQMLGMTDDAQQWLRAGIYSQQMQDYGHNLLASCPQNAILFVNGDNDTYPLWWTQEQVHFRQDVTVLNLSLMNDRRYLHYIYTELPPAQRIELGAIAALQYDGKDYFVEVGDLENHALFGPMLKGAYPGGKLSFSDGQLSWESGAAKAPDDALETDDLQVLITARGDNRYFLRQDVAVLSILTQYLSVRPICFSNSVPLESSLGFDKHFRVNGLLYIVQPYVQVTPEWNIYGTGSYPAAANAQLLNESFSYAGLLGDVDPKIGDAHCVSTLRRQLWGAIASCVQEDRTADLASLLQRYGTVFPPERYVPDAHELELARVALASNQAALGNRILTRMLDEMRSATKVMKAGHRLEQRFASMLLVWCEDMPAVLREHGRDKDVAIVENLMKMLEKQQ